MNKVQIAAIVLVLLLAGAGAYIVTRKAPEAAVAKPTYENPTLGYSFSYPEEYAVNAYTSEFVGVGKREGEGFLSVADVSLYEGEEYESFDAFVLDKARTLCAADGPDETINCTDVIDAKPFTAASGLTGNELYLLLAQKTFSTGETKTYSFGPVYVFPYEKEGSAFAAIFVYQPLPSFLTESHADIVGGVARSFKLR